MIKTRRDLVFGTVFRKNDFVFGREHPTISAVTNPSNRTRKQHRSGQQPTHYRNKIITSNDVPSCRVHRLTMMWNGVLVCMNLNACEPFRVSLTKPPCVPVISVDAGRSQIDPSRWQTSGAVDMLSWSPACSCCLESVCSTGSGPSSETALEKMQSVIFFFLLKNFQETKQS
jgi:hypothetical protein